MSFLKKLMKLTIELNHSDVIIKPLKSFSPVFICEECAIETNQLSTFEGLLCCNECTIAKKRRARFLAEEAEWEASGSQNENEE